MSDQFDSAVARQARQQPTQLTPYPDVNAVVNDLLTDLQASLGAQLVGMYLVGSLALGDFDPQESDLDLVIVTAGTLSDETLAALRELHRRVDHSASAWAARLDAVYIPKDVLREAAPTAARAGGLARYPVLEWPAPLALAPLESGWPIWRYTLREHGVVVSGPDPRSLLDSVHPDDLRRASGATVEEWRARAHSDAAWVAGLRVRREHTYVVRTLCRLLYTLDAGSIASKLAATRWVTRMRASGWSELIGRVATEPDATAADVPDVSDVSEDAVRDTLAFLEYTAEQFRQWQASSTS